MSDSEDRFAESTRRTHGVVDEQIPEDEIYRSEHNHLRVSQFQEDGKYWINLGASVGLENTIFFDSVDWRPGEYGGTLYFERECNGEKIRVGSLEYHPVTPMLKLGLVGEWLAEQVDLTEYRAGIDCPECSAEVLHIGLHSTCEDHECGFYVEGHLHPPDDAAVQDTDTDGEHHDE